MADAGKSLLHAAQSLPADPLAAGDASSTLLKHASHQKVSDADKLKLLEFKTAASASLIGLHPKPFRPYGLQ